MTDQMLLKLLDRYNIQQPEIIFLRHNENRTYRINDNNGKSFLLRIHEPLVEDMKGLQHTYEGLLEELHMLESYGRWSSFEVQTPVRNAENELLTVIEHNGQEVNCSILTWLDGRDMNKDDFNDMDTIINLGSQLAELHTFFMKYKEVNCIKNRPSQGKVYNERMIQVIQTGVGKGLFTASDAGVIEQTLRLVNSRLDENTCDEGPELIHGDLGLGNTIITTDGGVRFIDYGFFGTGYTSLDVAMGAVMIPAERRDIFLKSYYKDRVTSEAVFQRLEGFMLTAIIGYYVFQIDNKEVHAWMRERMPKLCMQYCTPFLKGESIFYKI
ncbi:phosphotransferase [Neobacillus mesonae]|nr:phosphotransferase [Neobacillus mesonae]